MKSIRVKPQQGDQRAEKLHGTEARGGGGNLTALPNSSRGKKVSQDAEREKKKIPHPALRCQQCEVPRD